MCDGEGGAEDASCDQTRLPPHLLQPLVYLPVPKHIFKVGHAEPGVSS